MCFADNNLGAKIDFSVFEEKDIIKYLFAENIGIVFQAKDDAALESKLNANNVAFYKMGTVTTEATLDLGPSKLDIAKYRDIWFKTSFFRSKQSKNGMARVLTIKLYFSNTFHRKKPVIDASRLKAAIIREKEVTQNAKWQMPCILPVLM
jgi:phosphoribosylformylglycinamidine synthase